MLVLLILYMAGVQAGVYNEYSREDLLRYREEVREMFQHSYNSYLEHA